MTHLTYTAGPAGPVPACTVPRRCWYIGVDTTDPGNVVPSCPVCRDGLARHRTTERIVNQTLGRFGIKKGTQ